MRVTFTLFFLLGFFFGISNPVLHWRFANPVVVQSGFECALNFDVEVAATEPGTYHVTLATYIEYDSSAFGDNIAMNGKITYARGDLIDLTVYGGYVYGITGPVDGNEVFCFVIEPSTALGIYEEMPLYPNYGILFHISIIVEDPTQAAGIKFKESMMSYGQSYIDATHPYPVPYGNPPEYNGIFDNDLLSQNLFCFASAFSLNIKANLEGPFNEMAMSNHLNQLGLLPLQQPYNVNPWNYNGTESITGIPANSITDWVLLELRDAMDANSASSATVVERKACFVLNNAQVVSLDGSSLPEFQAAIQNNLYLVLWHRNHLGIMSANPVDVSGGSGSYDFTASGSAAYGGSIAQKEMAPGTWGLFAGDGNADGNINSIDKIIVWKGNIGIQGYNPGDFNMDGNVNNTDKINCWSPNGGRSCQVPQ